MTRVVYHAAVSADGYIATSDGGVAWLAPFEESGIDHGFHDFLAGIDGLLFGSRTYEQSLTFGSWPFAGKPCWVFSRRHLTAHDPEVSITTKDPRDVLAECESRRLSRIWLVGGGILASSFRKDRLIDEYIFAVVPIILGSGIPLFAKDGPREDLRFVGQEVFPTGIILLKYENASSMQALGSSGNSSRDATGC